MKLKQRFIKSTVILSMVASTALYATNGDTLVGVGAKTRAMGGAGIAFSHGAESTLVNPALITRVPDTEISFGGTVFMPTIKTETPMSGGEKTKSDADISMIPAVAIVSHLDNGIHIGAGMYGTAGMGTDFRGHSDLFDMETTLQLMQFVVPVAYKTGGLSLGIAPILQYGSLDIHYVYGGTTVGDGQHQDYGFGANVGLTYDFGHGITLGAMYKSKIKMDYDNAIPAATRPFGLSFGSHLDQPAEFGIGLGWRSGSHGIAIDWKRIQWSHATGYSDFGWDDQDVFAIGYQYDAGTWALRAGFNHGKSPIRNTGNDAIDMFNLLGFPATQENHLTLGGSYVFNKNFSADLTAVYGFNKNSSADVSHIFGPGATVENKHSELGLTVQLNYKF